MKPKFTYIIGRDRDTLDNALRTARERYTDLGKEVRGYQAKYEAMSPKDQARHDEGMVHGSAYRPLAEQMELQAREVDALIAKLEDEDGELAIVVEP